MEVGGWAIVAYVIRFGHALGLETLTPEARGDMLLGVDERSSGGDVQPRHRVARHDVVTALGNYLSSETLLGAHFCADTML